MDASVPIVEVTDHADAARIRRPNREGEPAGALDLVEVRAEFFINLQVTSFIPQMQIEAADGRQKRVGVANREDIASGFDDAQLVAEDVAAIGNQHLEETAGVAAGHRPRAILVVDYGDLFRFRAENANRDVVGTGMSAEDRMRIGM